MKNEATIIFYKPSGKYYSSGNVYMGDVEPWCKMDEIVNQIRKSQMILITNFKGFYVALGDTEENFKNP